MTMPRILRAATGLAVLATALAGGAGVQAAAGEADGESSLSDAGRSQRGATTASSAGYCKSADGVTVVVDFSALGGDIVVRCVPSPVTDGVAALQKAGFEPAGTTRYGLAFICRISGRPAADEVLTVDGEPYEEQCVETPPQLAHWSYWAAPDGGKWAFLQSGASSHHPIAGGFEGWSYTLNLDADSPPGIEPTRPAAPSPPPLPSPTPSPTPTASPTRHPPTTRPTQVSPTQETPSPSSSTGQPSPTPPTEDAGNPPGPSFPSARPANTPSAPSSPRATSSGPPATAAATSGPGDDRKALGGGSAGRPTTPRKPTDSARVATTDGGRTPRGAMGETVVTGDLPGDASATGSAGSPLPAILGAVLIGGLAAGAALTAWRRSREE